jgi:F420H(2)-dependent quinone reductase
MDVARTGQKLVTGLHVRLYRWTGGKIGQKLGKVENVILTTTGRKSGQPRSTPLTVTVDGDRLILIASNGGAQKHPDWYVNLSVEPKVSVQRGKAHVAMLARTATAEERPALWERAVATYKGYAGYQTKTEREIPVVICEPIS